MIFDTIGAVLAFLGLIAPGLVFELLREHRRPQIKESSFREAGRIALTSLLFTLSGLAILSIIRVVWPEQMPDPGRWLREGARYMTENYRLVARALVLQLVLACSAAGLVHIVLSKIRRERAEISHGSL